MFFYIEWNFFIKQHRIEHSIQLINYDAKLSVTNDLNFQNTVSKGQSKTLGFTLRFSIPETEVRFVR